MKLCTNCKNYREGLGYQCASPNLGRSMVNGYQLIKGATEMRINKEKCGPDAVWFVQKPEPVSFWKRMFK